MAITGLAADGNESGLSCPRCGDPCAKPQEHLTGARVATTLLSPDDPCQLYTERAKWGRRWRVVKVYRGGKVRHFVDDMGAEEAFALGTLDIPSFGDLPSEWNTVGECFELAGLRHQMGPAQRIAVAPPSVEQMAQELVNQHEYIAAWRRGRSHFGATGFTQRSRDWIR